jgi:hypothetical protein
MTDDLKVPDWVDGYCAYREQEFAVGDRAEIIYPFSLTYKIVATGWVVGYRESLVDYGGPESGPGPVEPCMCIVVKCDDGKTRVVDPGVIYDEGWRD